MCGLDITFIKSVLYKRIVIKLFWTIVIYLYIGDMDR